MENKGLNLDRINELYKKSKNEGLTEAEKKEQAGLRKKYIASVRNNLRGQLDNISIVEEDGSITDLSKKGKHWFWLTRKIYG